MYEFTVGTLKEKLKGLPDDMPVMYQRIEDVYFEKHNWTSVEMRWEGAETTEYIPVFTARKHWDNDVFVIDAHY